jgi:hypothetical protein
MPQHARLQLGCSWVSRLVEYIVAGAKYMGAWPRKLLYANLSRELLVLLPLYRTCRVGNKVGQRVVAVSRKLMTSV